MAISLHDIVNEYTVYAKGTRNVLTTLVVIDLKDFYKAVGKYTKTKYKGDFDKYFTDVKQAIENHMNIRSTGITWYCAKKSEFDMNRAIEKALEEKNNYLIIEKYGD